MELWFTEKHTDHVNFSIKVKEQLYSGKSYYQQIDVFDSFEFGRFLTLDGILMLTEKDEFIYHEMMVHVPMACNPSIRNVLVIGAGDGGTVRELCRYPSVECVDLVEIDDKVIEICKEFLPKTACRFDDPRVHIYIEDGLKFVRRKLAEYDLIVVDSTDPFGPGEGLFTKEFYGNCFKALTDDGILVNQHESTYYDSYVDMVKRTHARIGSAFPVSMVYQAHIPTYPSGHWLFGFASKNLHPVYDLKPAYWNSLGIETRYYNTELHKGCFALPNYVNETLESDD
ncbi:MAG: polyamine aminopropyltransferase [Oscillospiraceae bacterium]